MTNERHTKSTISFASQDAVAWGKSQSRLPRHQHQGPDALMMTTPYAWVMYFLAGLLYPKGILKER